jgi:UDP-N-acetylglucosamine acyltransferase
LRGLNLNGLRRRFDRSDINDLKDAYKKLFSGDDALKDVANELMKSENEKVRKLAKFVIETKRGIPFKRNINE